VSVTPSEWALLRALAWHSVMLVQRGGVRARSASLLRERNLISVSDHSARCCKIRITDAGRAMAAKIEKELK
jgi:DNA-binding MarR family transcriptional regulator